MAHAYIKRATKEYKLLTEACQTADCPNLISVTLPDEANLLTWHVKLRGPDGTLYKGGLFTIVVELTADYPYQAPKLTFLTKMYHPSVATDGKLCEKLVEDWAPTSTVKDAVDKVVGLFSAVIGHEVLNEAAAKQFHENPEAFKRQVELCVKAAK